MDQELLNAIEQLKRGEEAGFNYIYSKTYKLVYFQARGHLKNEEDVQDLVQAVYLSVYRSIHSLQDPNAFYGWLKTIVRNQAGMMLRKFRDEVSLEEGMEGKLGVDQLATFDITTLPEASMEQKAVSEIVADIISELPELQKSALLMYYYENMKVEEIAEVMGCSTGTIKSRLNYARKRIGERVEEIEKKDGIRLHALAIPTIVLAFRWLSDKPVQAMAAEEMKDCVKNALQTATVSAEATVKLAETAGKGMTEATFPVKKVSGGVLRELRALSGKAKAVMVAGTLALSGGTATVSSVVTNIVKENETVEVSATPEIAHGEKEETEPTLEPEVTPIPTEIPKLTATPEPTATPVPTPYVMSDAEQKTLENLRYEIVDEEVTILGLVEGSSLTAVVIPAQIEGCPVTRINESAFYKCHITSIVFPDTLTEIGEWAFYKTHIKEVYIPESVTRFGTGIFECSWLEKAVFAEGHTTIPSGCFERCDSLKEVILPSTVKTIEDGAFFQCGLTEIEFPEGLEKIGKQAFFCCEGLEEIVLPDSVKAIGKESFYGCKKVKRLVLSKNLKVISNKAFGATGSLIKIDIPEGVGSIEGEAFRFSEILEVSFPASLSYIDDSAFAQTFGQCNPMKFVYAPSGSYAEIWAVKMGYIAEQAVTEEAPKFFYTVTEGTATLTGMDKATWDHLIIPKEIDGYPVTRIAENAFVDCNIRVLEIPETVTLIENNAIRTANIMEAVRIYGGDMLFIGHPIGQYGYYTGTNKTIFWVPDGSKAQEWAKGLDWLSVSVYVYEK